jgi:hypothetical protein
MGFEVFNIGATKLCFGALSLKRNNTIPLSAVPLKHSLSLYMPVIAFVTFHSWHTNIALKTYVHRSGAFL